MKKKLSRKQVMKNLSEIQTLIGRARGAYMDDRAPDRAEKVLRALDEAFQLALDSRD